MSTSHKTLTCLVAVALFGTGALAGCGQDNDAATDGANQSITIALSSSPSEVALREIAKEFEAATGIAVTIVDLTYEQIGTKVLLAGKQNTASYDVVQFDSPMLAALAAGGALADIGTYIAESDKYDAADVPEQVQEYSKFNGTSYGVALSTEPYILWNNAKLLADNGLIPADTLDQYAANAKALQAAGAWGSNSGFGSDIGAYYWLESVYLFGGRLNQPGQCVSALDSPQAQEATEFYFDMLPTTPPTSINGGGNEMTTAFVQGDVGQMINATGYYSIVADPEQSQIPNDFEMTPPPQGDDGRHTLMFGWLIGVTENSTAKDAAWSFIEYALGKDAIPHLIDLGAPPPARYSLTESQAIRDAIPYVDLLVEAAATGEHLTYTPVMSEIITEVSALLSQAATDGSGAAGFLPKAQAKVTEILGGAETCG
ncbi:MAG: extracellular solute-binding protein [Bifidobacteriaceae bacterium]|jgi:multiple sugar transport system substrate-binding protein|nr:extracellular solute-binding protein [Bifidobacteriaceae bacterium]